MQFIAFGNLNFGAKHVLNGLRKGFAAVAPVGQNAGDCAQSRAISLYGLQGALTIRDFGCGDCNRVGQAQRIDQNVAFDA